MSRSFFEFNGDQMAAMKSRTISRTVSKLLRSVAAKMTGSCRISPRPVRKKARPSQYTNATQMPQSKSGR